MEQIKPADALASFSVQIHQGQLSVWPFPADLAMTLDLTSLIQSSLALRRELHHHKIKPNRERGSTFFSVNNSLESALFWLCVGYGIGQAE